MTEHELHRGGTLSRVVPQHVRSTTFHHIHRDWMLFATFKAARKRMGLGVFDHCWWCKTPFQDADMMALAFPAKGANRVLCAKCLPAPQGSPQT